MELGRRLRWEALRGGLGRGRAVLAVGDDAPWIWHLLEDRLGGAVQLLDFYHAGQHLWAIGRAPQREGKRPRGLSRGCTVCAAAKSAGCSQS